MKKKIFFENLDGLRFLCFLSVFFFHSFHTEFVELKQQDAYHIVKQNIFGNGNLGVNFFFVLSGFLITFLLIEEKKLIGKINIPKFWLRRALRIWPLFFFCVGFGFVIFPLIKQYFGQVSNETADPWYYMFFLNNIDFINKGLPDSSVLGVLWSVAIEEQFYFVWPVLLAIIPFRFYWILFVSIILFSCFYIGINNNDYNLKEYHTFSCIGDLATGALGAWLIHFTKLKDNFKRLGKPLILLIYFIVVFIFFWRDEFLYYTPYLGIIEKALIAFIFLAVILEQCYAEKSLFKFSNFKLISKFGLFSYGLYCLHFIGILVATTVTQKLGLNTQLWQVFFLDTVLALVFTITIAYLSYRFFEQPFLRIKERFAFITKS